MYRFILLLLATQPLAYQALRDPNILAPYFDNFRSSPTASPTKAYPTAYPTGLYFKAGSASTDATCSPCCAATDFKVGDNSLHAQRPTPHATRHTPNATRPMPLATRQTPNAKRQTSNAQCPRLNAHAQRYNYNFNLPLDPRTSLCLSQLFIKRLSFSSSPLSL
jgi:hypothetical protein